MCPRLKFYHQNYHHGENFRGFPELQNAWIINKRAVFFDEGLCFVFIVLTAEIEEEQQK